MTHEHLDTMTVGELKEYLEQFSDGMKVAFSYPSGDHWHTQVVGEIKRAEKSQVKYTGYHDSFKVLDDEDDADNDEQEQILILGE